MGCSIRLREFGGPDVLRVERSDPGHPGPNEVRLRQTAIGVNFIDTVQRRGVSPIALSLPSGIGGEAPANMAVWPISSRMVAPRPHRPTESPGQAGFCPWNSSDVLYVCLSARTLRAAELAPLRSSH